MHRFYCVGIALIVASVLAVGLPLSTSAQDNGPAPLCFPQTGQCLEGTLQFYWKEEGQLPVFGYPIAPAELMFNAETGKLYLSQWLERTRFEVHEENQPPYQILLGRLGEERLRQLGIDWWTLPREPGPRPGCLWFVETGHNVCDQERGVGFRSYWLAHGLNDRRLTPYGRSLALFGFPLTTAREEVTSSGERILTQWFERARFEWHPDKPRQYRVLLGRLGSEIAEARGAQIIAQGNVAAVDAANNRVTIAAGSEGIDTIAVSSETIITRQSDGRRVTLQDIRAVGAHPQGDSLWAAGPRREQTTLHAQYLVILSQ